MSFELVEDDEDGDRSHLRADAPNLGAVLAYDAEENVKSPDVFDIISEPSAMETSTQTDLSIPPASNAVPVWPWHFAYSLLLGSECIAALFRALYGCALRYNGAMRSPDGRGARHEPACRQAPGGQDCSAATAASAQEPLRLWPADPPACAPPRAAGLAAPPRAAGLAAPRCPHRGFAADRRRDALPPAAARGAVVPDHLAVLRDGPPPQPQAHSGALFGASPPRSIAAASMPSPPKDLQQKEATDSSLMSSRRAPSPQRDIDYLVTIWRGQLNVTAYKALKTQLYDYFDRDGHPQYCRELYVHGQPTRTLQIRAYGPFFLKRILNLKFRTTFSPMAPRKVQMDLEFRAPKSQASRWRHQKPRTSATAQGPNPTEGPPSIRAAAQPAAPKLSASTRAPATSSASVSSVPPWRVSSSGTSKNGPTIPEVRAAAPAAAHDGRAKPRPVRPPATPATPAATPATPSRSRQSIHPASCCPARWPSQHRA